MSPSRPDDMSQPCPSLVPDGDDIWGGRTDAYSGGETPSFWTPEHVMAALVGAYDVLRRAGGRVGPKSGGNAWPEWIRDETENVERVARPTAIEASQADAALSWSLSYLKEVPLSADALGLWASCEAVGRDVGQIINKRRKIARRIVADMQAAENRSFEMAKARAVQQVAKWADDRLSRARTPDQKSRIRSNAHIRLARAMDNLQPARIEIWQGMPGKVISTKALDHHRRAGAIIIADRLNAAGVVPWAVSLTPEE